MKSLLPRLGSLKIAIVLLVGVLLALSAGTIVESAKGREAAGRAVYDALWFQALLGLLCVNVLCSVASHFPWGKWRVGFLLTHAALVVIPVGALVSYVGKTEGHLALWEGQVGSVFVEPGGASGAPEIRHDLPFSVKLDDFQIDYYQGTRRPAMFRSLVHVIDAERGAPFSAVIQMNRPLRYRGYELFQASYEQTGGRERTVLAVSRDPGQPVVFLGYALLLLGLSTVLGTRLVQARARAQATTGAFTIVRRVAAMGGVALVIGLLGSGARAASWDEPASVEAVGRLSVQHDGRVMPFDTYAREVVRSVTGRRSWHGESPTATVLRWSFDADRSADEQAVKLDGGAIASACGLPAGTAYVSFRQMVQCKAAMEMVDRARIEEQADRPVRGALAAAQKLEGRLLEMQAFLQRTAWTIVPDAADMQGAWSVPALKGFDDLLARAKSPSEHALGAAAIDREIAYNAIRPTRVAWVVLGLALLVSITAFRRGSRVLDTIALSGLTLGVGVMTWGIATRWVLAGRIPAANMYESLLFLAWGVGAFALLAFAILRNRLVVVNATAMAALTMALTDLLPIDGFIHPVAPVLAGTPWLAIHVPIIMVSYSVLALGVVVAHMQIGFTIFRPGRRELIARMNDLLYWYILVGSILLVAGIITGSIWASGSWGRYWGWDPKEVWSLVAFLAYMAILHGRVDRILGPFGVAAVSIVAFQTILMTYLGVNFVLTTGMHSYGFGESPVVGWMALVAAVEGAFLLAGYWAYRKSLPSGPVPVTA